jgi:GH25 family lysozyme M1 (1,4-beta-N-acetylmuramidase)
MYVFQILQQGDEGVEVKHLQRTLPAWCWGSPVTASSIDGKFGSKTRAAVTTFQEARGLPGDGIAGPETCRQLGIWAEVIPGIDVSDHQGNIDWPAVTGVKFVYCKATEGKTFQAASFGANYAGARARGFLTGAYHFARGGNTPHEEVENFLSVVTGPCDLPAALDVEGEFALSGKAGVAWILAWLEEIERRTGDRPVLYTSSRVVKLKNLTAESGLEKYKVWFPKYGDQPETVVPWDNWWIWQYSSSGTVPGVPTRVDQNWMCISK